MPDERQPEAVDDRAAGDEHDPADERGALEERDPADERGALEERDDLDGYQTPMSRLLSRTRGWLAIVVAASLLVPFGTWLVDEYAFGRAGADVAEELGPDAEVLDAMLLVRSTDCAGSVSTGSAFVVEIDGTAQVVTNRHVVEDSRSIAVRALDGGPAVVVDSYRSTPDVDVAVLEFDGEFDGGSDGEFDGGLPVPAEPLRTGGTVTRGEQVRVVGFPSGRPTLSAGSVESAASDRLVLDLRVDPGASGSPVIDAQGRVVGQVHARTADGRGVATPVATLVAAVRTADAGAACG